MRTMSSCFAVALLASATLTHTVPKYFAFEGHATYSTDSQVPVGTPMRYVFLVDTDLSGYTVHSEGASIYEDFAGYNAFYVKYVDSTATQYDVPPQHTLTLEADDGKAAASDAMILTIENTAPTAVASGAGSYEAGTSVSLGGEVSDFDGDLLHYEWIIGGSTFCSGDISALSGGAPVALGACSAEGLALGSHLAVLQVSDGINAPVEVAVAVEVVDTSFPTLATTASAQILWPPNHRLVDIEILSNAADNSGAVALSASVSSNEAQNGLGDGDLAVDWDAITIDPATGKIALKLRAERSGKGTGRVYSVTVTATDPAGNTATAMIEVKVPHSQSKK